jgi:hypothetical protein
MKISVVEIKENDQIMDKIGLGLWCLTSLSTIFQLCFIGGGNWRKPQTCHKSLTFIT